MGSDGGFHMAFLNGDFYYRGQCWGLYQFPCITVSIFYFETGELSTGSVEATSRATVNWIQNLLVYYPDRVGS